MALLSLAAAPTVAAGLLYIAVFGVGSILGVAVLSAMIAGSPEAIRTNVDLAAQRPERRRWRLYSGPRILHGVSNRNRRRIPPHGGRIMTPTVSWHPRRGANVHWRVPSKPQGQVR